MRSQSVSFFARENSKNEKGKDRSEFHKFDIMKRSVFRTQKNMFSWAHGVWKSQKKSLRAKRATVNILSGQKFIKNAKIGTFWRVFENLKLAVKQCYQTGQF